MAAMPKMHLVDRRLSTPNGALSDEICGSLDYRVERQTAMKLRRQIVFAVAAAALTASGSAIYAQSGGGMGRSMMERFQTLDANGDAQVTAQEAGAWHESVFLIMDADQDGKLTKEEYMAVQKDRGADPTQRGPRYEERQADKAARFTHMDHDKDSFVTKEQFLADGQARFVAADLDKARSHHRSLLPLAGRCR